MFFPRTRGYTLSLGFSNTWVVVGTVEAPDSGSMRHACVAPQGRRASLYSNFIEHCEVMHREPEHVLSFILADLNTTGSIDSFKRLSLRGRVTPKDVENVLCRYISKYVTCKTCRE